MVETQGLFGLLELLPPTPFGIVFGTVVVLRGIKSFTETNALDESEVESNLGARLWHQF